ncbi:MAG: lipopolysaccharide biosynthesis protein [Anaerolineales bacterium]
MKTNFMQATVRGVFWTYTSYYLGKVMVFISTVILARLLAKSDFGVVSFALLIIGFLDMINGAGIGSALIYYQGNEKAVHSAFWLDLAIGIVMVLGTWLLAPLSGNYFDDARVVPFIRVLSLVFLINSLEHIPNVLLARNLSFNLKFIPDTLQAIIKGSVSIVCALGGVGAWSLIIGHVSGSLASLITYWIIVPWRPKLEASREWIWSIFSYGSGIVATNILSYILVNVDYLFVGYYMGAAALGVYTVAFRIPDLLIIQFCSLVGRVIFPVYARMKDDPEALNKAFLTTMNYVSLVTVPAALGLMLIAKPFVWMVFTDKWVEAIPVMRAISLYALFLSLVYNVTHIYKARGAISAMTSISVVRAVILIPALWWASASTRSIEIVGWTHAVVAFIGGLLNLVVAARLMKISIWRIFVTLQPSFTAGACMAVVVWIVLSISSVFAPWVQVAAGIITGAATYLLMLAVLQKGIFLEIRRLILSMMPARTETAK